MRAIIVIMILFFQNTSTYSKEEKLKIYQKMEIEQGDIYKVDMLGISSRENFYENGGIFQVLIPKENFIFKAPNCKNNIILRLPSAKFFNNTNRKEEIDHHWDLKNTFQSVKEGRIKSLTVPIDPRPYMKLGKNGEPILTYCNAFIPADFWKYSLDKNESNALEKPVEQQNAPIELENK